MVRTVPSVKNRAWPQTAVDNYILAKLEASGLSPSSCADKRTLIRRITFDLVGLPPTPGEINAFLADRSPDAFSRIVDRLLASPRYGERWGRHWLDVARYADSNGFDENVAHGNAWRYRDYVVSAFNRDKPFDRFVIEQLAGWLVDPQHPLTARVFVNRVWRWHFGRGLVRTTDNFGLLGEDPSHSGLLDYLARRFVTDQWSVKTLHRLIVMSSTYQQETSAGERTLGRDPENHLYSRGRVRRLEAETVRDALLAASGQLDPTMRGSLLELKNRAYFFDHTSKDLTTYDSRRRSLYLPVVRNNVFELFGLLDFPDPAVSTGDRSTTVVASQALLMLNSEFVMQAAARLTDRLLAGPGGDDQRLVRLYTIAFGREPTDRERESDRAFLSVLSKAHSRGAADPDVRRTAWGTLCHVVLATNEFIYLR
jgi:hypothetical protein